VASHADWNYLSLSSFHGSAHECNRVEVTLLWFRIRFFQIFGVEVKRYVDLKEVIYISSIVVFGLLFEILNVSIQAIINFDGAFILVLLDVILPMWIHYRCIFKDRHSGYIEDDEEWNASIQPNKCQCDVRYRSKWMLYLETFMMVVITIGSIFLMASTLITIWWLYLNYNIKLSYNFNETK